MRHLGSIEPGIQDYIDAFNEAWQRSMLPHTERYDMTPNGNYQATGRDIHGNNQDELEARFRAVT
jgi:hypothetical protein